MVNTIDKGIGIPDQLHGSSFHGMLNKIFFFWFSFNSDCILGPLIGTSITQSKEDASIRVKVLFLLLRSCYRLSFSRCRSVTFWQFFKGFQVGSIVEIKIKSCIYWWLNLFCRNISELPIMIYCEIMFRMQDYKSRYPRFHWNLSTANFPNHNTDI